MWLFWVLWLPRLSIMEHTHLTGGQLVFFSSGAKIHFVWVLDMLLGPQSMAGCSFCEEAGPQGTTSLVSKVLLGACFPSAH